MKEWISGKKEQDLVVSFELMKGFEDPLIIDLAGYIVVSSRSSSKVVKVNKSRYFAAFPYIKTSLLSETLFHIITPKFGAAGL